MGVAVFRAVPAIEELVDDQNALAVADLDQLVGGGVVGDADGVAPHLLENVHLTLQRPVPGLRAQRALVVVLADALELHVFAVELKAHVGGKLDGAEAKLGLIGVQHRVALLDGGYQDVEVGRTLVPGTPELGAGDGEVLGDHLRAVCGHAGGGGGVGGHRRALLFKRSSVQLKDLLLDGDIGGGRAVVLNGGGHRYRACVGGFHLCAVPGHMDAFGDGELHVAVDARAGIPAAGGNGVVGLDGDDVFTLVIQITENEGEGGIAVVVLAQLGAVEVDLAVHVNAAEVDGDGLALPSGIDGEGLAVPTHAANEVAALGLAGGGVLALDGVVVGKVHRAPGGVVVDFGACAIDVAQVELPVFVEVNGAVRAVVAVDGDGLRLGGSLPAALSHLGAGNGDQFIEGGGDVAPSEFDLGHAGDILGDNGLAQTAGEGAEVAEAALARRTDRELDAAGLALDKVDLTDGGLVRQTVDEAAGGLAVHVGLEAGVQVAVKHFVRSKVGAALGRNGLDGGIAVGGDVLHVVDDDLVKLQPAAREAFGVD